MSDEFILLGDDIVPARSARVSALDRGFLYGESVFTTLRAYAGALPFLPEHHARLQANAAATGAGFPWSVTRLAQRVQALLRADNLTDKQAHVRVQVSSGVGTAPGLYEAPGAEPTVLALAGEVTERILDRRWSGVSIATIAGLHLGETAAFKLSGYTRNRLCTEQAQARGADEGVFLSEGGEILEAATANLFFVSGVRVCTPALAGGILPGITRSHVIGLCARLGMELCEGRYRAADLLAAEEVFLSSSISEIVPVRAVDGREVPDFAQRPITRAIQGAYDNLVGARIQREA